MNVTETVYVITPSIPFLHIMRLNGEGNQRVQTFTLDMKKTKAWRQDKQFHIKLYGINKTGIANRCLLDNTILQLAHYTLKQKEAILP